MVRRSLVKATRRLSFVSLNTEIMKKSAKLIACRSILLQLLAFMPPFSHQLIALTRSRYNLKRSSKYSKYSKYSKFNKYIKSICIQFQTMPTTRLSHRTGMCTRFTITLRLEATHPQEVMVLISIAIALKYLC